MPVLFLQLIPLSACLGMGMGGCGVVCQCDCALSVMLQCHSDIDSVRILTLLVLKANVS